MARVRVFSQEELDFIYNQYSKGIAINKIATELKTDKKKVSKAVKDMGFNVGNGQFKREYIVNHNTFKTIDTEHKAYMLGYLMADGSIGKYNNQKVLQIHLCQKDEDMLVKFLEILNSNYPIKRRTINSFDTVSNQSYIYITSEQIYEDLKALNMLNKSTMPTIPKKFINHYIRGYFDGDGCFSIGSRGDAEFYIMAEKEMLSEFKKIFKNNNIEFTDIKHKKEKMFKIRKSGRKEIQKIYNFLYKDSTIWLNRKREKMEEYLNGK